MPTVRRIGPYRFFFQRDRKLAKFWLRPVALASASGFAGHEIRRLRRLVESNRNHLEEAWHEFFDA